MQLTTLQLGQHQVPGWWRFVLPEEVLRWRLPEERRATCMSCPKVVSDGFRPDYRCCTYHPQVPNFLLGMALSDKTMSPLVENMLVSGFLTPEGARHTPAQWMGVLSAAAKGAYGQGEQVLCQFLQAETGLCGIYPLRNSACSTFFCVHDAGAVGSAFWEALHHYIHRCELALMQWTLQELGFDRTAYLAKFSALSQKPLADVCDLTKRNWQEPAQKDLWGERYQDRLELLKACGELVWGHRHRLLEIVNQTVLSEADFLEIAALEDTNEPLPLAQILVALKRAYHDLWQLPVAGTLLRLAPGVEIFANSNDSPLDRHYAAQAFKVRYRCLSSGGLEKDEFYISQAMTDCLKTFIDPQIFSTELIERLENQGATSPEIFLAEWLKLGVIIEE